MPIDVGNDARVRAQRVDQQWVAGAPRDDLNQLAGGDGTVLLALLANGPFGRGHLVLGVAVEFAHAVLVLVLVETLQG